MIVIRFRNTDDHKALMKKVKKMKEFTEDLEECLEEAYEDEEMDYRSGYRKDYDDMEFPESRYAKMRRRGSR